MTSSVLSSLRKEGNAAGVRQGRSVRPAAAVGRGLRGPRWVLGGERSAAPEAGGQGVGHGSLWVRRYRLSVWDDGKFQKWTVVMVVQRGECT